MRKIFAVLIVVIVLVSQQFANAAVTRGITVTPELSYRGTEANCSVRITGNTESEYIQGTMKLWYRNRSLQTWNISGVGYILFSDTFAVEYGKTYRLSIDVAFDGEMQPTFSISKTCE